LMSKAPSGFAAPFAPGAPLAAGAPFEPAVVAGRMVEASAFKADARSMRCLPEGAFSAFSGSDFRWGAGLEPRLGSGLGAFVFRVDFELPARAEDLAEDLTIVAFWSVYRWRECEVVSRSIVEYSTEKTWGRAKPMLNQLFLKD